MKGLRRSIRRSPFAFTYALAQERVGLVLFVVRVGSEGILLEEVLLFRSIEGRDIVFARLACIALYDGVGAYSLQVVAYRHCNYYVYLGLKICLFHCSFII